MNSEPDHPNLDVLLRQYIRWLEAKGHTPFGVRTVRLEASKFVEWCKQRAIARATEVSRSHVLQYQEWLFLFKKKKDGKPLAQVTQYCRLSAMVGFFRWLAKHGHVLSNPASDLELPRLRRKLPQRPFTIDEVEAVLSTIDVSVPHGVRNRAIFELFYSSGLRRFELAELRVHDLDFDRGTLLVRKGKGQKERVVPFGARAQEWLIQYLREARPLLLRNLDDEDRFLFLSHKGGPLVPDAITRLGSDLVRTSGHERYRAACHIFRHTAATHMLEGGADIRIIQQFLGHESLDTTQIYTKVTPQHLKEVHSRTHPAKLDPEELDDEVPDK